MNFVFQLIPTMIMNVIKYLAIILRIPFCNLQSCKNTIINVIGQIRLAVAIARPASS